MVRGPSQSEIDHNSASMKKVTSMSRDEAQVTGSSSEKTGSERPMETKLKNEGEVETRLKTGDAVQVDAGLMLSYSSFVREMHQQNSSSLSSSPQLTKTRLTSPAVCYIIISATSTLWTVLTIITGALIVLAILTPQWLVVRSAPVADTARSSAVTQVAATVASRRPMDRFDIVRQRRQRQNRSTTPRTPGEESDAARRRLNNDVSLRHRVSSMGLFNECSEQSHPGSAVIESDKNTPTGLLATEHDWNGGSVARLLMLQSPNCDTFVTGFDMPDDSFPDTWKSGIILLTIAGILLTFTCFTAGVSVCIQSLFGKSIFTVSGLIQSIAALLVVIGQLLYTAGWSSRRVRDLCGDQAGPFVLDKCHIGASFYCCMAGTLLLIVCALLSIRAENATSTDDVEKLILNGRRVVCVS